MSPASSWYGLAGIKHLVVFGASYCDVGYNSKLPHPSVHHPLGVEFPGDTWCEPGKPNWVGHIIQQAKARLAADLLVYDYALGGDTVAGVRRQIHDEFLPHLAPKPEWAPWTSADTLFLTWVGINDCAINARALDAVDITKGSVDELFGLQEELYQAGARHFCLIDVPPTYRFPDRVKSSRAELTVLTWNARLNEAARTFAAAHSDATILVWSSWELFNKMFADPTSFGFREEDLMDDGGVFVDGLHPTTAVHEIIAAQLFDLFAEANSAKADAPQ